MDGQLPGSTCCATRTPGATPPGCSPTALRFLLPTIALDPVALERAVEISSFENMRRLEAGAAGARGTELVTELNKEALRPKDPGDPDSYKVRRGKVGGYTDYLDARDVAYLNRALERLDPRYGYAVPARSVVSTGHRRWLARDGARTRVKPDFCDEPSC